MAHKNVDMEVCITKWKSNTKHFLVMLLVLSLVAGLVPANVANADQILPVDTGSLTDGSGTAVSSSDYPEFPNEGSVIVHKNGTDVDFQSSGIAHVEIAASGVPIQHGVDIILMLDLSSSMERHAGCGNKSCNGANGCKQRTRLQELEEALESLGDTLQASPNSTDLYIEAAHEGELTEAFNLIAHNITYAARNARFVDQIGDDYDLQMKPLVDLGGNDLVDANGEKIENRIEVVSYEIYTKNEADADPDDNITEDMIGDRKLDKNGHPIYHVLETVWFNENGTEAYSDQIGGGTVNILAGSDDPDHITGVIYARHFYYNNNPYAVHLGGVKIPTGVNKDGTTTGTTDLLPCGMMPRPEVRPLDTGFQAAWERLREETGRIRMPAACTKCPRRSVCPVCAAVCVTETGGYPQIPGQAPSDEYSVKAK